MTDVVTTKKDGVLIVVLAVNRIWSDLEVAKMSERLANLAHSEGDKVLVDFGNLQQMCSAMLGKLVTLSKECDEHKITLRLCSMQPHIKEVFTTTGLHKLLKIHDTQEAALAAFRKKGWFW